MAKSAKLAKSAKSGPVTALASGTSQSAADVSVQEAEDSENNPAPVPSGVYRDKISFADLFGHKPNEDPPPLNKPERRMREASARSVSSRLFRTVQAVGGIPSETSSFVLDPDLLHSGQS